MYTVSISHPNWVAPIVVTFEPVKANGHNVTIVYPDGRKITTGCMTLADAIRAAILYPIG